MLLALYIYLFMLSLHTWSNKGARRNHQGGNTNSGRHNDVPREYVVILSAKREGSINASVKKRVQFIEGGHYVVLITDSYQR